MKPEHYLKVGDIIFLIPFNGKGEDRGHFIIVLKNLPDLGHPNTLGKSCIKIKYFSSHDLTTSRCKLSLFHLNHISEGFWEFK